jgi:hypothetical protein
MSEPYTIRASHFSAAMVCPGSVTLYHKLERDGISTSTQFTAVGTNVHEALAAVFSAEKPIDVAHKIIRETLVGKFGYGEALVGDVCDFWDWLVEEGVLVVDGSALTRVECHCTFIAGRARDGRDIVVTGTQDLVQHQTKRLIVADWKCYQNPGFLKPMVEDLQMICYGVGVALAHGASEVVVRRYLVYHQRVEELVLDEALLKVAREAILEEAQAIFADTEDYRPGANCHGCLLRKHCKAFQGMGDYIDVPTEAVEPYRGGQFATRDQVLRFLLAIPVVESMLEAGKELAKAYANENGPIVDPVSGSSWGPQEVRRDEIVDAAGCLAELMVETDKTTALGAAKTTKGNIETALKLAKRKPKERSAFLGMLREKGLIKSQTTTQHKWSKAEEAE